MFNLDGGSRGTNTEGLSQERLDQIRIGSYTKVEELFGLLGGVSYFPRDIFSKSDIGEILRIISNQDQKTLERGIIVCEVAKDEVLDGPGYVGMMRMLREFCEDAGLKLEIKHYSKLSNRMGTYIAVSKNGDVNL